jgi:hypothetical protein
MLENLRVVDFNDGDDAARLRQGAGRRLPGPLPAFDGGSDR